MPGMKIAITGSSGHLGQFLVDVLQEDFTIVKLGRKGDDIDWTLGALPKPEDLQDVKGIIHLAWSLRDRRKDHHINKGGTIRLAQMAADLQIPMLFVSSVAVLGNSYYGSSKLECEEIVKDLGGSVLRFGIVKEANMYTKQEHYFKFVLKSKYYVNYTSSEDAQDSITNWLKLVRKKQNTSTNVTVVSGSELTSIYFKDNNSLNIWIPMKALAIILRIGALCSRRARNLLDALNSLATTPRIGH